MRNAVIVLLLEELVLHRLPGPRSSLDHPLVGQIRQEARGAQALREALGARVLQGARLLRGARARREARGALVLQEATKVALWARSAALPLARVPLLLRLWLMSYVNANAGQTVRSIEVWCGRSIGMTVDKSVQA